MPNNYKRYFITLSEASSEFSMQGKKALGKCIIEAKNTSGKIIFSVQNIKPDNVYGAYIVAAEKGASTAVEIGRIAPDTYGRGQIKWECDAIDVEGSGAPLTSFNVAGLMIINGSNVTAPLVGTRDINIIWKNNIKLHSKRNPDPSPSTDEIFKVPDEPLNQPIPEPDAAPEPELHKETEAPYESLPENFFETIEEGSAEKMFKDMAKKINEKLSEPDGLELEGIYRDDMAADIHKIGPEKAEEINMTFRNCSKIRPFKENPSGLEWVRITPNELIYLPDEYALLQKDSFISALYKRFGHLILGRKAGGHALHIALGLPDVYDKANEKNAYYSGFGGFTCCDSGDILEGKHGYWLKESKHILDK